MSTYTRHLREQLVRHYRWLRRYGLNDSHSGNASVRNGSSIWLTPTGACADLLKPKHLIRCRLGKTRCPGASLDTALHFSVYECNPQAQTLLHSHGPYSVAWSMEGQDFIPPDFEGQYYFKRVPVLNIAYGDYLTQAPEQVGKALAKYPLVMVKGHGVYAQAESINLAYKWTCSLEQSAKTAWLRRLMG